MPTPPWPYNLPIWRTAHRAPSPDGKFVAELDPAREVSMGNPTMGTLRVPGVLSLDNCNPSFIWSSDGRYLAVPRFHHRFRLFWRQQVLLIDVTEHRTFISRQAAWYFQPETFEGDTLVVTANPFKSPRQVTWRFPADLAVFQPFTVRWD